MASGIPVIDLQAFPGETAKLIEACEEWGCFRIVNYEEMLPESLLQEMRNVVKSLFALPAEIKMKHRNVNLEGGYLGPSAKNPLYESFGALELDDIFSILDASPIQRNVISNYAKGMNEVKAYIARKIGEGLGVKGFSIEDWCSRLRFNKYNFTPETLTSPGVQPHTDPGFLTVLHDDKDVGGFEVMKKSGEFEVVDPCSNTLVVNLGDAAHAWSNGRFLSVKHRVMCQKAGMRLTIASFLMGPRVGMVEAPPELVDSEHPRLFSPFTYEDHRILRFSKNVFTGEVMECYRIRNNKD